jgi:hypothetical protein
MPTESTDVAAQLPLSDDQRELLRRVFIDAFSERDDSDVPYCEECAAAAGALCTAHEADLDQADRYHELAIDLGVLPPGPLISDEATRRDKCQPGREAGDRPPFRQLLALRCGVTGRCPVEECIGVSDGDGKLPSLADTIAAVRRELSLAQAAGQGQSIQFRTAEAPGSRRLRPADQHLDCVRIASRIRPSFARWDGVPR